MNLATTNLATTEDTGDTEEKLVRLDLRALHVLRGGEFQ
jgi:hypothetical protein